MSRRENFYEYHPINNADWSQKSRTFIGQIESVRPSEGVIQVKVAGVHDSKLANIPLWALHYAGANSSWSRYMPEAGAFVRLGYGPRNELEVLNYLAYGEDPDQQGDGGQYQPRLGGYKALTRYAKSNTNLMRPWRDLRPGEHDLRSAGGAGYYFARDGRAIIESGPLALELNSAADEARMDAGLTVFGEDGVEVRFGTVKRVPLTGGSEVAVDASPDTSPASLAGGKEWRVRVTAPVAPSPAPAPTLFEDHAGDIRNESNPRFPPLLGPNGLALRRRMRHFDPTGFLETLGVTVDVQGNVEVSQIPTATFGIKVSCFKAEISAVTSARVSAGTTLDLDGTTGVNINAGGDADDGIVKGQALSTYLTTKLRVPTAWGLSGTAILPLSPGVEYSLLGKVK